MKRREFLYGLAAGVAFGAPAMADGVADSIIRQLKRLGFRTVSQERTLLGRIRIVAKRGDGQREIIVNPKTGEILRDLWMPVADGGGGDITIIDGGHGRSGDDDDDDDDDDDNSGSGGGDSESGGGDDGGGYDDGD
ncbi:MAG: hypothetical protein V4753_03685 [Pseudomonadota bacterium]